MRRMTARNRETPYDGQSFATGTHVGHVVYGVLVIGLVDNILRPMLVGKDTKMPDYVVLISTLGGMATYPRQV